ncbi:hypothetical protein AAMO2058_001442000 [Amorphochlora amoebiformis]
MVMSEVDVETSRQDDELKTWEWKRDEKLSQDENLMRLALVVARNSDCIGGHMGCILTQQNKIIAKAVNSSLFDAYASDIHAEVNALGVCARKQRSTQGATCYVTMPPCRKCFTCLVASGITRIVTRRPYTSVPGIADAAKRLDIELSCIMDSQERLEAVAKAIVLSEEEKKRIAKIRTFRKNQQQKRKDIKRKRQASRAKQMSKKQCSKLTEASPEESEGKTLAAGD